MHLIYLNKNRNSNNENVSFWYVPSWKCQQTSSSPIQSICNYICIKVSIHQHCQVFSVPLGLSQ